MVRRCQCLILMKCIWRNVATAQRGRERSGVLAGTYSTGHTPTPPSCKPCFACSYRFAALHHAMLGKKRGYWSNSWVDMPLIQIHFEDGCDLVIVNGAFCNFLHRWAGQQVLQIMDRGWFIGPERIPLTESDDQTINLTGMLQEDKPKTPIAIRPPVSSLQRDQEANTSYYCEPKPKPIIKRTQSLPSITEEKKQCRNVSVRFVDSLGLDLEDVRFFSSEEYPSVPHHVTFRLRMAAELADERHQEISLPYMKPVFAEQPGDHPGFLHRLCEQKVCLERVVCFELGVIGITQVVNLGFAKDVTARFSFTEWKSCTETKASWVSTITKPWEGGGQLSCDTFRFHLPVPPFVLPGAVLEFAIKYKVCGDEYWDNNAGENYKLVCQSYNITVPKECEDSMVHFI